MAAVMNDTVNQSYCDAFDVNQRKVMSVTRGGAGILCLIPTVIALALFIYIQAWKNFRRRILLFLTASTILYLIFFILQTTAVWKEDIGEPYARLCTAIGFSIQYFGWQQLLLVSSIAVYFYFYRVRLKDIFGPRRRGEQVPVQVKLREAGLFVTLLLVPFVPAGLGLIKDGYGETRGWCWIRSLNSDCEPSVEGILRQIFLWYMWCVFCGALTLVFLIKVTCAMHGNANQHGGKADALAKEYKEKKVENVLLLIYIGVFNVVNVFELVACIISFAVSDYQLLFVVWEIYAVLSPISVALIPNAFMMMVVCCENVGSAKEAWKTCCSCRDDVTSSLGNRPVFRHLQYEDDHESDDQLMVTPSLNTTPSTPIHITVNVTAN